MTREDSFLVFVKDQLAGQGVLVQPMFGGFGLRIGPAFVGIVLRRRLYLKVDPASRSRFEAFGMGPFRPSARQTLRSFYEVPAEVLEDAEELGRWLARARRAAGRARGSRQLPGRNRGEAGRRASGPRA